MAGLKERRGLKITFQQDRGEGQPVFLSATFVVGNGVSSHDFISTEEIRERMDYYDRWAESKGLDKLATGEILGHITIRIEKNRKDAVWTGIYPFKGERGVEAVFRGHGIGQVLEWRVLNEAKKRFPGLKKIRHADRKGIEKLRVNQLERRYSGQAAKKQFLRLKRTREAVQKGMAALRGKKLKKHGFDPAKRIKFKLEREKLRERIRLDTLKHRKPKVHSPRRLLGKA